MAGKKKLSHNWQRVLRKLAEYGREGIDEDAFCQIMGDDEDRSRPCRAALGEMFFLGKPYYEKIPLTSRIRVTLAGHGALVEGD